MSNFKSGSGDLDFSDGDKDNKEDKAVSETAETQAESEEGAESTSSEQPTSASPESPTPQTERSFERPASSQVPPKESAVSGSPADEYPYFVRRSNVGDERDTRLEIHLRDKVADQEAQFRSELAEQLGTNEIAKTDAREFALLTAFQDPESVAELMQSEGFGALD
jgi:hypothetical protein